MRTRDEMVAKLIEAQKSALATKKYSPSWDSYCGAVERVNDMRDLMGLPEWDEKSTTVEG